MPDDMKYEVHDPEIEARLKEIGRRLKDAMPEGYGFNLMIFSYGEGGAMFYLSSAQREDMIKAMKEFIAKYDKEN